MKAKDVEHFRYERPIDLDIFGMKMITIKNTRLSHLFYEKTLREMSSPPEEMV